MSREEFNHLFSLELALYRHIDACLCRYVDTLAEETVHEILVWQQSIHQLHRQQQELFSQSDLLQSSITFSHFVENHTDLSQIKPDDALYFKMLVMQLLTCLEGSRLISLLAKSCDKAKKKITVDYSDADTMSVNADELTLHLPKNSFKYIYVVPGKDTPLVMLIPFISLAHEFIHCLLHFDRSSIAYTSFPLPNSDPSRWFYSMNYAMPYHEELRVIEDGNIAKKIPSENTIRRGFNLSLRGGWMGARLEKKPTRDLCKILWLACKKQKNENLSYNAISLIMGGLWQRLPVQGLNFSKNNASMQNIRLSFSNW